MSAPLRIVETDANGFARLWPVFQAVIAAGDTLVHRPDLSFEEACKTWATAPSRCFLAERDGTALGCYYIKPNQPDLGDHIANAGYVVAAQARGQGVASAMCEHSLAQARQAGFAAMQFNFVVSTNAAAVRLWQRHGFNIVGTVPCAFRHAELGPTDIYGMHRTL